MYSLTRLPNGLTIATAAMPQMASVSVGIWIGVGSRYETAGVNGVCHFIEHLLFKGTRRRSARDISQAVEGIGGYLNAFTSEELTCIHARALHSHFDELLDVLLDMMLNSRFAPDDVDKEREVIKEELAMYLDQPQQQVQELLNATLWPRQPLGRPITGTRKTLDSLNRSHCLDYLRSRYVAGATVIAAAGRLSHRQIVKAVSRQASRFPAGLRPKFSPAVSTQSEPQIRLIRRKTEQTQIALGIRACSRHDDRRYALRLLNAMLGENMSSRLFQVIREDHGLAYSIYSSPSFFEDTGDLVISAGLDTENVTRTLKLIMIELRRFVRKPPTAAELQRARDFAVGQIDLGLESSDNQMNWLGEHWLGYGRLVSPGDVKRRLHRITPRHIQAIAHGLFRPERMNLALVSPRKSVHDLKKILVN